MISGNYNMKSNFHAMNLDNVEMNKELIIILSIIIDSEKIK